MTAVAATTTAPGEPLALYRDDGPLARALGPLLGGVVRVPGPVLMLAAVVPLVAAIALTGDTASDGLAAAVVAWAVLAGGAAAGRPLGGRVRWTVPPAVRLLEYAGLLWLASLDGDAVTRAAFVLLAVLAFRHYDLVYRLRFQGATPPRWLGDAALGWEGRLIALWLLLALDLLPAALWVAAGVLAVAFAADCVAGWKRFGRDARPLHFDDEEDEAA